MDGNALIFDYFLSLVLKLSDVLVNFLFIRKSKCNPKIAHKLFFAAY